MSFNVCSAGDVFEITISQSLTKAEILKIWESIEAHTLYGQAKAGLVILEKDTKWDVTADDMADLGRKVQRLRALPWAIVALDPLSFGMIRMFVAYATGGGIYNAFTREDSAREWLRSLN